GGQCPRSPRAPRLAGPHPVYLRQVLTSSLHQTAWPDVLGGAVDQATFVGHVPRVAVQNASVVEGGTANVTVSLSEPSTDAVNVTYRTTDGTAKAPEDYTSGTG